MSAQARAVAFAIVDLIQRVAIEHGNLTAEARDVLEEKLDALIAAPAAPPRFGFSEAVDAMMRETGRFRLTMAEQSGPRSRRTRCRWHITVFGVAWRCDRTSDEPGFEGHTDHVARREGVVMTWASDARRAYEGVPADPTDEVAWSAYMRSMGFGCGCRA